MITKTSRWTLTGFMLLASAATATRLDAAEAPRPTAARPNILWISCEDIGPHLGCYQAPGATTPNLDALAKRGVRYTRAHTVTGVCATCRASMITGMYPSTLGNQYMRCAVDLPAHVRLFPQYLRDAGYYCTNNSKTDYNVTGDHGRCWDESSRRAHWRNRPRPDQPFYAVFNFTNTHESRVFNYRRPTNLSDEQLHDPADVVLPPYYPDTPVTRRDWAHYLDNITSMDKMAGELLDELDRDGLTDSTIVIFWSDHGAGLPRAKRWIYESGTHVPLIVHIPPAFRQPDEQAAGTTNDELISLMDLGPTTMNLVGLDLPDYFHGQPFLGKDRARPRDYLFFIRDRMDERYDMIRGVSNGRFKYLRNFEPYKPYFQVLNYMEQEHTMQEMRRLHRLGMLPDAAEQFMGDHKPVEEFYDLRTDPHEIDNLLEHESLTAEQQQTLADLRAQHRRWIIGTRDTGLIPEAELDVRGQKLGTRFDVLRQPGSVELLSRLWDTNGWACNPQNHRQSLLKAARDPDAAVRFWAITGLGNLAAPGAQDDGPPTDPSAEAVVAAVRDSLRDTSPIVRVAAARAIWQIGQTEPAIQVLRNAARSDNEWVSLRAMHVIDEMDQDAAPLEKTVRWVRQHGKKYPVRVATFLLSEQYRP